MRLYVACPFVGLFGLALASQLLARPYLGVFGLMLVAIGVLGPALAVLERRWDRERPGPVLATSPDGSPSTLLARAPWSLPMRWAVTAMLTVPAALAGVLALLEQRWGWAVALLGWAVVIGRLVAPRGRPGGLHLSPATLTVDDHGNVRTVPWDDIEVVVPGEQAYLVLRGGKRVRFEPMHIGVHPTLVFVSLRECVRDPAQRRELGTPASLEWRAWKENP